MMFFRKKRSRHLQTLSFAPEDVVKTVHVDFCIRSDILDKETLTRELGILPTRAWNKGEEYLGKSRDPDSRQIVTVQRKKPWGIWGIDTIQSVASKRVEDHAQHLMNLLEPQKDALTGYLQDKINYSVRFLIWWEPFDSHGSYELSSEMLIRMAGLCHYVEFLSISTDEK